MTQRVEIVQKVKDSLVKSDKRHRIIVGGRGKGASWSIARILLLEGMTEPLFLPCVREVQKTIKYSVKKLLDDTIKIFGWQWFYDSTETEIRGMNGTLFVFYGLRDFNADNIKSLEGADRCWVAEAQSISRRSINILRPTIRKEGSVIWSDFNPRYDTDPIYIDYIVNNDPNAEVLQLNWRDNPWFTKTLKMELESDYARNEEEAKHIWEGELRSAGEKHILPAALIISAMQRVLPKKLSGDIVVGADLAHQGGDEIVFYKRIGLVTVDKYFSRFQTVIKTLKDLKAFAGDESVQINLDNGFIGCAVADLLEDEGFTKINRINFGGTPKDTEHYADVVTEMFFDLRDILIDIYIPYDEELLKQLSERKYEYINGKRGYEVVKVESKDTFKEHSTSIYKSPDRGDGLLLTYYEPEGNDTFTGTITSHNYMG